MRHLKSGKQLGRNSSHRKAMYRNMVVSLLDKENITTTDVKAKELRRHAEKLITLGKRGTISARRMARVMINDREVLQKLFTTLADRFKDRPGGYTRIIKLGMRAGDNAPLSSIQLVTEEMKGSKKTTKKAAPTKKKAAEVKETKTEAKEAVIEEKEAKEAEAPEAKTEKKEAKKEEKIEAKVEKKTAKKDETKKDSAADSKEDKEEKK